MVVEKGFVCHIRHPYFKYFAQGRWSSSLAFNHFIWVQLAKGIFSQLKFSWLLFGFITAIFSQLKFSRWIQQGLSEMGKPKAIQSGRGHWFALADMFYAF